MLPGSRRLTRVRRQRGTAGRRPVALPAAAPRGDSGERLVGPRSDPDNGGSRRASPLHARPPGLRPRDAPGITTLRWPGGRGLGGPGTLGRCPRVSGADPPRGTGAGCAPLWVSREGTCGPAAPRELAESVGPSNSLSPTGAAASCPGVPGSRPCCGGGRARPRRLGSQTLTALSPLPTPELHCFV